MAVTVITAKTGGKDVDIATRGDKIIDILIIFVAKTEGKIVDILAVTIITAKTGRLLAKNVIRKK